MAEHTITLTDEQEGLIAKTIGKAAPGVPFDLILQTGVEMICDQVQNIIEFIDLDSYFQLMNAKRERNAGSAKPMPETVNGDSPDNLSYFNRPRL